MAPICRFYQLGSCTNPKCTFLHSDQKVCQFYLQGNCRFGNYCELKHEKPRKKQSASITYKPQPSSIQIKSEVKVHQKFEPKERVQTEIKECVVCFENVEGKKRFGLMDCIHCVCLDCIREWRGGNSKTCPICRSVSNFVVPSYIWPSSPAEKSEIIQSYKTSLG